MENVQRNHNPSLTDDVIVCIHDWPIEGSECVLCLNQKLVVEDENDEEEIERIWGSPKLRVIVNDRKE